MTTIALAGLTDCGGRLVGPIVAKQLGFDYMDRLILQSISENTCPDVVRTRKSYEQIQQTDI